MKLKGEGNGRNESKQNSTKKGEGKFSMIQLPWNNLALTKSVLPLYRVHLRDWRRRRMRVAG